MNREHCLSSTYGDPNAAAGPSENATWRLHNGIDHVDSSTLGRKCIAGISTSKASVQIGLSPLNMTCFVK